MTGSCWIPGAYLEPFTSTWIECGGGPSVRWALFIALMVMLWMVSTYLPKIADVIERLREAEQESPYIVNNIKAVDRDVDGRPIYLVSFQDPYSSPDEDEWVYAEEITREQLRHYHDAQEERLGRRRSSSRRRSKSRKSGTRTQTRDRYA